MPPQIPRAAAHPKSTTFSWFQLLCDPAHRRSLNRADVNGLGTALLNERPANGDVLIHLVNEHVLCGLMVLYSHGDIEIALGVQNSDWVACFRAGRAAGFMLGPMVSALQITPQVDDLALDRNLWPLRLRYARGRLGENQSDHDRNDNHPSRLHLKFSFVS